MAEIVQRPQQHIENAEAHSRMTVELLNKQNEERAAVYAALAQTEAMIALAKIWDDISQRGLRTS